MPEDSKADQQSLGGTVAIVGCGLGGIAAGIALKKAGLDSFTIFEQSGRPGGTWWDNGYPGAAVDVLSTLYSYSFYPGDWTRTHATRDELMAYVEEVIDRFGLTPHIEFNSAVREARWLGEAVGYSVETESGELRQFRYLISAVGQLNYPNYPEISGLGEFEGPAFHTARWDSECDLDGKRVAVLGTGSTAAQVVPAIAPQVERLYVFQREPNYVLPKGDRSLSAGEVRAQRVAPIRRVRRSIAFFRTEWLRTGARVDGRAQRVLLKRCLDHLGETVHDPSLRRDLTPGFPFYCKRPVISSDFYPALQRDNVSLVPRAVVGAVPGGVVDSAGDQYDVDVLVMATGFTPTEFLKTIQVTGPDNREIHDVWAGEPSAFFGLSVPGFPNFFMLYGPNTNGGSSIIFLLETQARLVTRLIQRSLSSGKSVIEVSPTATNRFNDWIQRALRRTAYMSTCNNYYRTPSGRVVTQWPFSQVLYWLLARTAARSVFSLKTIGPR